MCTPPAARLLSKRKIIRQTLTDEIVAPTTVVGIYPWDLPPAPETSSSAVSTKTSSSAPLASSYSSWELQPGVPTMQPSFQASYLSSAVNMSSTQSTSIAATTPNSLSQPASTTTSVLSLISLIPGPTALANATTATSTASAPHASCSDKSPFTIGVSLLLSLFHSLSLAYASKYW